MTVTVITPSIPERHLMLAEGRASVDAQTHQPARHLVGVDHDHQGIVPNVNSLVNAVDTEWFATLADDDLFYPHHLETLLAHAGPDIDFVYSRCDCVGEDPAQFNSDPPQIPWTALYRTEVWRALGGYNQDPGPGLEDTRFWRKALAKGHRLVLADVVTWTYRFHGANHSRQ